MHQVIYGKNKLEQYLIKLLNQIEKVQLNLIDDFGLPPLDGITRLALLHILDDQYGIKSTVITSQLSISKLHSYIEVSTVVDPIMDRLAANTHLVELEGDSLRKRK